MANKTRQTSVAIQYNQINDLTRSVVAGFGRHGMPPPMTRVQHFVSRMKKRQWPLSSRVIHYVCDRQKQRLLSPSLWAQA